MRVPECGLYMNCVTGRFVGWIRDPGPFLAMYRNIIGRWGPHRKGRLGYAKLVKICEPRYKRWEDG